LVGRGSAFPSVEHTTQVAGDQVRGTFLAWPFRASESQPFTAGNLRTNGARRQLRVGTTLKEPKRACLRAGCGEFGGRLVRQSFVEREPEWLVGGSISASLAPRSILPTDGRIPKINSGKKVPFEFSVVANEFSVVTGRFFYTAEKTEKYPKPQKNRQCVVPRIRESHTFRPSSPFPLPSSLLLVTRFGRR
jgi:hypothetical protein